MLEKFVTATIYYLGNLFCEIKLTLTNGILNKYITNLMNFQKKFQLRTNLLKNWAAFLYFEIKIFSQVCIKSLGPENLLQNFMTKLSKPLKF